MTQKIHISKAFVVLALCVCMLAGMIQPAAAASVSDFKDVSSSAWYYDAVSYAVSKGLFNGTSSTTFTPSGTMTRGMFAAVLGRYAGVDPDDWCAGKITGGAVNLRSGAGTTYTAVATLTRGTTVTITGRSGDWYKVKYGGSTGYVFEDYLEPSYHCFEDVDYGAYYAGYIIWGYEKGFIDGISSVKFDPDQSITREQICKLLAGYADAAGITLKADNAAVTFTDQSSISSWAASGVSAMQKAGVIEGEKDGSGYRFRPKSSATRAEAAAIFQRFASAGTSSGPNSGTGTDPDPSGGDSSAASFLSSPIACKAETVRVGILVNTQSYKKAVQTVTLENTNGSQFDYGSFGSDRTFNKIGSISSSRLTITTNGSTFTVKNASGSVVYTTNANLAIHPVASGSAITKVNGGYRYFGDFELRQAYNASGYISVISYVNIEDYVKSVLPYEFSTSWPAETLKAAAVATRSYVMASDWTVYSRYGFDVMGDTSAQCYNGRGKTYSESYFSATDAAVSATKGVYLTYSASGTNRICTAFYSACDGGATEDAAHIWGTSYSYLVGKVDPYEQAAANQASNYTHTITLSRTSSAMTALAQKVGLGSTTIAKNGIKVQTYPTTGNVKSITVTGTNGRAATINQSTSFDRWDFLSAVGFTAYSYRYDVTYNAAADTFTITRWGWGHNVGMSQWGAYAMGRYYNKNYQEILGFYYTGTHLQYGAY